MITVQGYRAFHGGITYQTPDNNTSSQSDVDILYNPITDCYLCGDITIPNDRVISVMDYSGGLDETCQDHLPVIMDEKGNIFDPCIYETVLEVEDACVEVLRCMKCGKVEISWRRN